MCVKSRIGQLSLIRQTASSPFILYIFFSLLQSPHLGSPGIQIDGLTKDQANLLQRYGPASDIDNLLKLSNADLLNVFKTGCLMNRVKSEDAGYIQSSGHSIDFSKSESGNKQVISENVSDFSLKSQEDSCGQQLVNRDTIGFFIAKFIKR